MKTGFLFAWICFFSWSCKNNSKALEHDIYSLRSDTLNVFHPGDSFSLTISSNSCCAYYFEKDRKFMESLPAMSSIRLKHIESKEADPDCAGCSSYTTYYFEAIQTGSDSLHHWVIPMGDIGPVETDALGPDVWPADQHKNYRSTYLIQVVPFEKK